MLCEKCRYLLPPSHDGIAVCQHCGRVNLAESIKNNLFSGQSPTLQAAAPIPIRRSLYPKHWLLAACLSTFLIAGLLLAILVQNLNAGHRLDMAVAADKAGNFQTAAQLLKTEDSFFITGSIKSKTKAEIAKNQKWQTYAAYQKQAESLISQQKYQDALAELSKITSDYPDYNAVKSSLNKLKIPQIVSQTQSAKTPILEQKTTPTATQAIPKSSGSSPVSGCVPAISISGQRYVDTSALGSVKNANSLSQVEQIMQGFFSQYGVTLEISNPTPDSRFISNASVSYDVVNDADLCTLKAYSALLIDEWSKYPKDWIANSNLKTVVLDKDQKRIFSGTSYSVSATYDTYTWEMWYDINYSGDYAREVIHHEFFHMLMTNYIGGTVYDYDTWNSYNTPGFSYGGGGASCYSSASACATGEHPAEGFATGYAESAAAEDQAETYAYLMTDTYYHHLQSWLAGDPILAEKVNSEKQFIASHSAVMTGSYFDQINP